MKDADFFLALSDDDENNILSALLAKKNGAKRALVITNDPEYLPILDSIGMDITINTRLITVSAILKHLRKGRVMSVFKLIEDAEVMEIGVEPDSSIVDKQISKIKFPKEAIIGAILRKGEMLVPNDEITLEAGDSVILVALPGAIEKIEKSQIKKLITTDTIDNSKKIRKSKKIEIISLAPMISEAMKRIANSTSVSSLFK